MLKQYWFTRYWVAQKHQIRLRLTTDDFTTLQPIIRNQIEKYGFTDLNDEPNATVIGSFGDNRVISPDSPNASADDRGQLLLNIQHAIAALFVDTLIGPDADGYFRQEKNTDPNNPHGSVFETVHHLLCNTTDVVTEVELFKSSNNEFFVESPLYAFYSKRRLLAQGVQVTDVCKHRVRF